MKWQQFFERQCSLCWFKTDFLFENRRVQTEEKNTHTHTLFYQRGRGVIFPTSLWFRLGGGKNKKERNKQRNILKKKELTSFVPVGCTELDCEGCHSLFSYKLPMDLTEFWLLNDKQQIAEQHLHQGLSGIQVPAHEFSYHLECLQSKMAKHP